MAWKCTKCGRHGDPNPKGVLGFFLLHGCMNCVEIKLPKPLNSRTYFGNTNLGNALKEIRKAKGFTLRHVENKCGVSNPYLSQIETGKIKDIGFKKLVLLCRFYDVDIKYFEQFVQVKKCKT